MTVPVSPMAVGTAKAAQEQETAKAEDLAAANNQQAGMERLSPLARATRGRVQEDWLFAVAASACLTERR